MRRMKLAGLLLAALVAGCAQAPFQRSDSGQPQLSASETQNRYEHGIKNYRESRYDTALADLSAAVASGRLQPAELANARKHIAFIHCISGRELQCREQFQALLKDDPDFQLTPSEAGHPMWGSVWRSAKGAADEQRALSRAGSFMATASQQKLAEGVKEYDAGRYKEALSALQAALQGGLPEAADELRAHKYSAFIYCLTQRSRQCRAEFRQLFAKDAKFELLPSEAGHPAWAQIYRSEKSAAHKKAAAIKKTVKKTAPEAKK